MLLIINRISALPITIAFIPFSLFLVGILFPNTTALALRPFLKNAGMAAALSGFFQMAASAMSASGVSWFYNGTALTMAAIIAIGATLQLVCLCILFFSGQRQWQQAL